MCSVVFSHHCFFVCNSARFELYANNVLGKIIVRNTMESANSWDACSCFTIVHHSHNLSPPVIFMDLTQVKVNESRGQAKPHVHEPYYTHACMENHILSILMRYCLKVLLEFSATIRVIILLNPKYDCSISL